MRKRRKKLQLARETVRNLSSGEVRFANGAYNSYQTVCPEIEECIEIRPGGGGGTGGSITCSVPFCQTLYPNTCASIGTC